MSQDKSEVEDRMVAQSLSLAESDGMSWYLCFHTFISPWHNKRKVKAKLLEMKSLLLSLQCQTPFYVASLINLLSLAGLLSKQQHVSVLKGGVCV